MVYSLLTNVTGQPSKAQSGLFCVLVGWISLSAHNAYSVFSQLHPFVYYSSLTYTPAFLRHRTRFIVSYNNSNWLCEFVRCPKFFRFGLLGRRLCLNLQSMIITRFAGILGPRQTLTLHTSASRSPYINISKNIFFSSAIISSTSNVALRGGQWNKRTIDLLRIYCYTSATLANMPSCTCLPTDDGRAHWCRATAFTPAVAWSLCSEDCMCLDQQNSTRRCTFSEKRCAHKCLSKFSSSLCDVMCNIAALRSACKL